jgi:hypothetical protein
MTFNYLAFQSFKLLAYLIKVIPDTCLVHYIKYLSFYWNPCIQAYLYIYAALDFECQKIELCRTPESRINKKIALFYSNTTNVCLDGHSFITLHQYTYNSNKLEHVCQ